MDFENQNISGFCSLDLEWSSQIVYLGKINVLHVVGTVVVLDLAAGPVDTLDLDDLAILDTAGEGNCVN